MSVTETVAAPGGVAAPVPVCRPNVYGSELVQLTEKPPPVAVAAPTCSEVYANARSVTADSVHAEVRVTLTLNWPEVLPACAVLAPSAAATRLAAMMRFICALLVCKRQGEWCGRAARGLLRVVS